MTVKGTHKKGKCPHWQGDDASFGDNYCEACKQAKSMAISEAMKRSKILTGSTEDKRRKALRDKLFPKR